MNKPSLKEISDYCSNTEQATLFYAYFESIDWMVGRKGNHKPMQNWKSAITGWITRSKKQSKTEKAISNLSQSRADRFWVRMSQAFGSKWVSCYGEKPTKPWINMIDSLSNVQVAHGLTEMLKVKSDWPSDLRQFYQLCISARPQLKALPGMTRSEVLALREQTQSIRNSELTKMRSML